MLLKEISQQIGNDWLVSIVILELRFSPFEKTFLLNSAEQSSSFDDSKVQQSYLRYHPLEVVWIE